MPPKPRFLPTPKDDQVLDGRNKAVEEWIKYARSDEVCQRVCNFIISLRCKDGRAKKMHDVIKGGYNLVYRLEYEDGHSVVMRVPIKDLVPFPDEKVMYEVSTMRYVAANTTIPVPRVYHHGTSTENPTELGPFIVMEYMDHDTNMSRELLDPTKPADSRPVLDPRASQDRLESLYGEMAKILLQLYNLGPFATIGSLVQEKFGTCEYDLAPASRPRNQAIPRTEDARMCAKVGGRPLTVNMIDLVTDTGAPHDVFLPPSQTFISAREWYTALAGMHKAQLVFQQGDCVEDEDDARDKYVARELFESLAASDRLFAIWDLDSKFRLFSEDLRPANVLLDRDLKVVGVVDWEFVYSAPAAFSSDPPWWLLLCQPEDHPGGIFSWMREYDKRLDVFLRALEKEELKSQGATNSQDGDPTWIAGLSLSQQMRRSWETGRWMVNYAARKSWMFDLVWWRFLDEAYFGVNEDQDYKARVGLLTAEQQKHMEDLVANKIRHADRTI
ncbi:Protein kinase-like domain containing protein [Rhypophila decipiens]